MNKKLVYTTIGYTENYIPCIEILLKSLSHYSTTKDFDILIICDYKLYEQIKNLIKYKGIPNDNIKIMILRNSNHLMQASINKLNIFEYQNVSKYEKVLYIDVDIIVTLDISQLFEENKEIESGYLYACIEQMDLNSHKNMFWSMGNYTKKELAFFEDNKIYPFNAGCFLFIPDQAMKIHFAKVLHLIYSCKQPFFFEQSFMNVYFNTNNLVKYNIIQSSNYVMFPDLSKAYSNTIIHFCGSPGHGTKKYDVMKTYVQNFYPDILSKRE